MTNLNIAKLYLATNTTATAAQIDAAIADGSAATAVTALTGTTLLNAIYQAAFGRDADAEGTAYWTSVSLTGDALVSAIMAGAAKYPTTGALAATAANDVVVADLKAAVEASSTNINVAEAVLLIAPVVDIATQTTATTTITTDYVVVNDSLTTANDELTGGKANDTFTASITTVNPLDSIVDTGTLDNDTLNMEINSNVAATFTTTNVENVNATLYGALTIDMTKMTGVNSLTTTDSTGALILTNINNAAMEFGMSNSVAAANNINAGFVAGTLSGASDTLTLNMTDATSAVMTAPAGYEAVSINSNGTSNSIQTFTATGVTSYTITGAAALDLDMTAGGGIVAAKTLDASAMTGALTTGTPNVVTGLASSAITGAATATTITLGSGNDNIAFTANAVSTVTLGEGDDTLQLTGAASATKGTVVLAGAGDDSIIVNSGLVTSDLINAGTGTDTVTLASATGSNMVLRGVENLVVNNAAVGANVIVSSDTALAVSVAAGTTAGATMAGVSVTGLSTDSTVSINDAAGAVAGISGTVVIGYATNAAQAAATIDVNTAYAASATTISNVGDVTIDLAKDATMGTVTVSGATDLTITGAGAISAGSVADATASGDVLKNVTITTSSDLVGDAITAATMASTKLETLEITAARSVSVGNVVASKNLSSVALTSTLGSATAGNIGAATVTSITSIDVSGKTAASVGTIDAINVGTINISASAGAVSAAAIAGAASVASTIGDITISGKTVSALSIGAAASAAVADTLSDITISSTTASVGAVTIVSGALGTVDINAATTAGTVGITATDTTGIDVNVTTGVAGAVSVAATNTDGNVTITLSGAATSAAITATAIAANVTDAIVNIDASDLTSTANGAYLVDNNATKTDGSTSTILLGAGASVSAVTNSIAVQGTVDNLVITGQNSDDTVVIGSATTAGSAAVDVISNGDIDLGSGTDTVDFSFVDNISATTGAGIAINLGATTKTFDKDGTGETTVAAGTAVEWKVNANTTTKEVLTDGYTYTLDNVESVVGTANADYIIANATGTTITTGAGADTVVGGASADTITTDGAGAKTITGGASGDTINLTTGAAANETLVYNALTEGSDIVNGFNSSGTDLLNFVNTVFSGVTASMLTSTSVLKAANFLATTKTIGSASVTAAHRFVLTATTGTAIGLYYDVDGSASGSAVLIGTFDAAVTAGDIVLV